MWSTAREIADGDLVIIWFTRDALQPLHITAGKELNTRFGVYRHSDLVGVPYGSKVGSRNGKGFIHVLRPTPELWTLALPHRTQILYLADIAFVTSWLDIKPGSRVIEAGTGSGSFSHSTARTIGPTGHLWSYEFHEARASKAREEFTRHGMDGIVTLNHRNVCKDGFTVEDTVDAVFLDLPAPWEAVQHAKKALRKDRTTRICCFSPCMEQVMRTVSALNDAGFTDITMFETLLRPQQVDVLPAPPSVAGAAAQLKRAEARREEKRLRQIAQAQRAKRKRDDGDGDGGAEDGGAKGGKRARTEDAEDSGAADTPLAGTPAPAADAAPSAPAEERKISVSKAFPEVRGHTSYLTFAVLLPPAVYAAAQGAAEAQSSAASGAATPQADAAA
ncbi:tRNA methyltransferase complex GCD14 subunit [Phanerochaete sordida]|uniref:tRNA (adenine(58)-N(1))-methyltransferase catalytic subunit TRM61 n=1 Tax=Phanerochaete sordida TaxID=48140 RepID=A0A9P3LBX1_9APHY|nr:tRNA methyltransferase complex GCD14 subunit [Phanerochaete sordida]